MKNPWTLIAKSIFDDLTSKEREELEKWLLVSKNQAMYTWLIKFTKKSKEAPEDFQMYLSQDWEKLQSSITQGAKKKSFASLTVLKVAAVVSIITTASLLVWQMNFSESKVYESAGSIVEVWLPDSSHVFLNKHSKLELTENFGKGERTMTLTGEAVFDVSSDRSRPFVVQTANMTVTAVGTHFNVKAGSTTEVTLFEGLVEIKTFKDTILLQPGNQAHSTNGLLDISPTSSPNILAWNTKVLDFNATPLNEVLGVLSTHYDYQIILADKGLSERKITTELSQLTVNEALDVVCATMDLHYEKKNKVYIVYQKKNQ